MFIVNFFIGLAIIVVGVLFLKYNFNATSQVSRNNVFERRLGPGSTYMVLKLVALLAIFVGFLVMFSIHDNFMRWLFAPLVNSLGLN